MSKTVFLILIGATHYSRIHGICPCVRVLDKVQGLVSTVERTYAYIEDALDLFRSKRGRISIFSFPVYFY